MEPAVNDKTKLKSIMTDFISTYSLFFDYVGYINSEGKEIAGAVLKQEESKETKGKKETNDTKEKMFSLVFKNAHENYNRTHSGNLKSILLNYEKFFYFIKSMVNTNRIVIKAKKGFNNYALIYAVSSELENRLNQIGTTA